MLRNNGRYTYKKSGASTLVLSYDMGTLFFVLSIVAVFVVVQRSDKFKAALKIYLVSTKAMNWRGPKLEAGYSEDIFSIVKG